MKALLRSVLWMADTEKTAASNNLKLVDKTRLTFLKKVEGDLLEEIMQFFLASSEAPALHLLVRQAEAANQVERVELLEEIAAQTNPFTGASFKSHLEELVEEQASNALLDVLRDAAKIATQGLMLGKEKFKGTDAAVTFLHSSVKEKPKGAESKIPAGQKEAVKQLRGIYESRKNNPNEAYGVMSGYGVIDSSTGGIRKKQLYIHAGYVGHLKSTCMLNMVLNAAVDGGWNPLVFSSEMPQSDMMFMLVAMHSGNTRFSTTHPPLSAFSLLRGTLDSKAEEFYDLVQDDLVNNKDHGQIRMVDTSEFSTFGSVMQRTIREHAILEVDILWVDYLMRLPVDLKYKTLSITEARNETIADAKRFAMSFNKGEGLAVCSPFQVNRDGFKRARDHQGRMDLTMLAQYNAAEKEADVVAGTFFGEEEQALSEPKLTVMKSRWGKVNTTPVSLFLEPDSRRVIDMSQGMAFVQAGGDSVAVEL